MSIAGFPSDNLLGFNDVKPVCVADTTGIFLHEGHVWHRRLDHIEGNHQNETTYNELPDQIMLE